MVLRIGRVTGWLLATAVVSGCGLGTEPDVRQLSITPEAGLIAGPSGRQRFHLTARDASGVAVDTDGAEWSTLDAAIATVDDAGVARGVARGVTTVTARLGGVEASATVEVHLPAPVSAFVPGQSYFGRNDYVEYIPGELPVVLSAPHGGSLEPEEIAPRDRKSVV